MVRNTFIYGPEASMKIIADIFSYTAKVLFLFLFSQNRSQSTIKYSSCQNIIQFPFLVIIYKKLVQIVL